MRRVFLRNVEVGTFLCGCCSGMSSGAGQSPAACVKDPLMPVDRRRSLGFAERTVLFAGSLDWSPWPFRTGSLRSQRANQPIFDNGRLHSPPRCSVSSDALGASFSSRLLTCRTCADPGLAQPPARGQLRRRLRGRLSRELPAVPGGDGGLSRDPVRPPHLGSAPGMAGRTAARVCGAGSGDGREGARRDPRRRVL